MTFRFLRWLHRRGVSRQRLRDSWLHRLAGDRLFGKSLWAFRREAVARGWLIGSLVAATPLIGLQLLLGVPLAMFSRANLLVVITLVFTTNPLTAGVFYPFAFLVGCRALGRPVGDFHWTHAPVVARRGSTIPGVRSRWNRCRVGRLLAHSSVLARTDVGGYC